MNQQAENIARSTSPRALLFGATGAVGQQVCAHLLMAGWKVVAITRQQHLRMQSSVEWRYGVLPDLVVDDERFDAIISCGPLNLFASWYAQTSVQCDRVVAFSSTSVHVKQSSPDQAERNMMQSLLQAEAQLVAASNMRRVAVTILRPTLIYGSGMDRNISRIASLAKRYGFFVLPHDAVGLRQPVHVADVAKAALASLARRGSDARSYDLAGGETLSYREMTVRILGALQPPVRLIVLPGFLFQVIAKIARLFGMHDAGIAVLARMREHLVFDDSKAQAELGHEPRPFVIDSSMLNVK